MTKREKIIEAAIELFTTQGFHATSTTSITQLAEVGTGTLFTHFKNKDDLINAIYRELKAEFATFVQSNMVQSGSPMSRFKKLWILSIEWGCTNINKFKFLHQFASTPCIDEGMLSFSFVFDLLEQSVAEHYVKPIPPELFYSMVFGNLYAVVSYIVETKKPLHATADVSFVYIWEGLRI